MTESLDLVGRRYGRLLLLREVCAKRKSYICRCDCGVEKVIAQSDMRHGGVKSCGCLVVQRNIERSVKHGASRNAQRTPEYRSWNSMLSRCYIVGTKGYKYYGGRGITVCERWKDFANFLADMGSRPKGKTLDRYPNNDGNYEPGNCRWATAKEQAGNRRNTVILTVEGAAISLVQACLLYGQRERLVRSRLESGWDHTRALLTPAHSHKPFPKRVRPK